MLTTPSTKPSPALAERPADDGATAIELHDITKRFRTPSGDIYTALKDLTLTVAKGEFMSVVGPTGCGKSTTLALISGLEPPSGGDVRVMGEPVTRINSGIGYVFQGDALFPWKSVLGNISAGLRFRGVRKKEAHARAREWIARVGLSGFEDHYPHQLSAACASAPRSRRA